MNKVNDITVVNGKEFFNDFLGFERTWGPNFRPTLNCLVHVWQKCNDIKEFWSTMETLFAIDGNNCEYSKLQFSGIKTRIKYWSSKGVKLKEYPHSTWNPEKERQISKLKELAEKSLV